MVTSWVHGAPNVARSIKALTWKCVLHRPKPPKAPTIIKKGKKMLKIIFSTFFSFLKLLVFQYMKIYVIFICGNRCGGF